MRAFPNYAELFMRTRKALGASQEGIAGLVGASRRTSQRWSSGESQPSDQQLHGLASHVFPHDPKLAADLAKAGMSTLEELGLVKPPAPVPAASPTLAASPAPPVLARPPTEEMIDALICAAAEAMEVAPQAVRPALRAAFERGCKLGITMEEASQATRPRTAPSPRRGAAR